MFLGIILIPQYKQLESLLYPLLLFSHNNIGVATWRVLGMEYEACQNCYLKYHHFAL